MKLLIYLLLCGFIFLARASQYGGLTGESQFSVFYEDPPFKCTTAGLFCSRSRKQCDFVYVCIPSDEHEWIVVQSKCGDNQTCNNGGCMSIPSAFCAHSHDDREFECRSFPGMYPDPIHCTDFHMCLPKAENVKEVNSTPITVTCPDGYYYNPGTTYCDRPLYKNQCITPPEVPPCQQLYDNGPVLTNKVLYYVCLQYNSSTDTSLYPYLYMCPNGKTYREDGVLE